MTEMNDEEFLDYCEIHSETARCGFIPSELERLCRLSGFNKSANMYKEMKNLVINCNEEVIKRYVKTARERLSQK